MSKIGVLVVHGIGDPKPGDALRDFSNTMAEHEDSVVAALSPLIAKQIAEPDYRHPHLTKYFPMYTRRGRSKQGDSLVFAEVYWGTATQLKIGLLGVVQGLGRLFFSIMHVVDGALPPELRKTSEPETDESRKELNDGKRKEAASSVLYRHFLKLVHSIAQGTSLLMAGPVLALNLILLIGMAPYLAIQKIVPTDSASQWAWLVPLTVMLLSIPLGVWSIKRSTEPGHDGEIRSLPRSWPQFWFGVSMIGLAVSWLIYVLTVDPQNWLDVAWFPARLLRHSFALVLLLLFVLVSCVLLIRLTGNARRELTAATLAVSLQYFLWVMLIPTFWRFLLNVGDEADEISIDVYNHTVFGDGLQWLGAAVLLLILLLAFGEYSVKSRRLVDDSEPNLTAQNNLRLIIHPWIQYVLLGMNWFGASSMLIAYYLPTISPWTKQAVITTIDWLDKVGITAGGATLLIFVAPLLVASLRLGLDLANDVMSYIYWNCSVQRRRENRERGEAESQEAFNAVLSQRRPIRSRFYAVAHYLLGKAKVDQLVVIAHSQGTVIALDELAHSFSKAHFANVPVVFVTMGSPISHLYQYYFPATYPGWQDSQWDLLFERVRRWLNVYRVDDIVGTTIDPPPERGSCPTDFFKQSPIGLGGHTNYWRDHRLIDRVNEFNPFEPIQ